MSTLFSKKLTFFLVFITIMMFMMLITEVWRHQDSLEKLQRKFIPTLELSAIIVRLNEEINYNVRLYFATREKRYKKRYQDYHFAIIDSISQLKNSIPKTFEIDKTKELITRKELTLFEIGIINKIENKEDYVSSELLSKYDNESNIFKIKVINLTEQLNVFMEDSLEKKRTITQILLYVVSFTLFIWVILWLLIVKKYHQNDLIRLKAEEDLRESQERFRDVALTTGDWIWETNKRSKFIFSSGNVEEIIGHKDSELIGKTLFNIMEIDNKKQMLRVFNDAVCSGRTINDLEVWGVTGDGKRKCFLVHAIVMMNSKNIFLGFRGSCKDITEVKNDEKEKDNLQKKMFHSSKLASIGVLAAGVGHEINNPLAVIQGNTEILSKKLRDNLVNSELWETIILKQEEAVKRIAGIVTGLRTYGRKNDDTIEIFNINKIIEMSTSFLSTIYKKEGVLLQKDLYSDDLFVKGNIGKMQQVIVNLLSNAIDATEGKRERVIVIKTEKDKKSVLISVTDNGDGIEEQNLNRIFDQFFTTKGVGKGTGLGLAIVKNIVENINGAIRVTSCKGRGSTFYIHIPLDERPVSVRAKKTGDEISRLKGRVLIVDDEEDIREILSLFMSDFGLEFDEAENGEVALEKVAHNRYDYIVTDLKMPIMGGVEFIEKLINEKKFSGKIFVITGATDQELQELPINGFISKPFNKSTIYKKLVS